MILGKMNFLDFLKSLEEEKEKPKILEDRDGDKWAVLKAPLQELDLYEDDEIIVEGEVIFLKRHLITEEEENEDENPFESLYESFFLNKKK